MFPCKQNFPGMYKDLICRLCGNGIESQEHLFKDCIYTSQRHFEPSYLFSDDIDNLKFAAERLLDISILL